MNLSTRALYSCILRGEIERTIRFVTNHKETVGEFHSQYAAQITCMVQITYLNEATLNGKRYFSDLSYIDLYFMLARQRLLRGLKWLVFMAAAVGDEVRKE